MLLPRVEEQLGRLDTLDQSPRRILVPALLREERVLVHGVDRQRYAVRPAAELRHRETRVEEQRSSSTWTRLGELLRRYDAERETGVHQVFGQALRRLDAALGDRAEPGLARIFDSLVE